MEHTWSGIATQTRVTSLKPKEELDLTTRLKKYFKLQDRYDSLTDSLGYSPTMEEFARRLGTKNVSKISAIMSDGPRQKAAMVRHNMGLVVNIINKYDHRHVTKEVRSATQSDARLDNSTALSLILTICAAVSSLACVSPSWPCGHCVSIRPSSTNALLQFEVLLSTL